MSYQDNTNSYEDFVKSVESAYNENPFGTNYVSEVSKNGIHALPKNRGLYSDIWKLTIDFVNMNNLLSNGNRATDAFEDLHGGSERLNTETSVSMIGKDAIMQLVVNAGIKGEDQVPALKAVGQLLHRYLSKGSSDSIRNSHWVKGRDNEQFASESLNSYNAIYPSSITGMLMAQNVLPGEEAFGTNIDKVITDIRVAIALTLLRFHKSMLARVSHQRNRASTVVQYDCPWAEVYDVTKTQNPEGAIRNSNEHRTVFLDLYRNPIAVTQKLQPIVPMKAKDVKNVLQEDGIMKFDNSVDMFDCTLDANKPGYTHIDWTDLVSEGAKVDKIYFDLTVGGVTERFFIDLSKYVGFSMHMQMNTPDSAMRTANVRQSFKLDANYTTATGATSAILAACDDTNFVVVNVFFAGNLNLKTAVTNAMCNLEFRPYCSIPGQEPTVAVKDLVTGLSWVKYGWSIDAKFSEENLRKSNIALRTNKYMRAYEIMCGRNYMIDYSIEQVMPEYVMSVMNEAMTIGQDHRALMMFMESAKHVFNRCNAERMDNKYLEITDRIGFDYVAGMRVNPYVYIDTIDLSRVESIRSSDGFGDVRTYVDSQLNKILSLWVAETLYQQQLEPGERVVFKVITSSIIKDNVLAVPSIHNHLNVLTDKESDGQVVEYTRVLPSGVELQFVTNTWDMMRNKVLMIPYRPNFPDSELNYCHNWVYGSFVAHYTPQIAGGVNKRVFANMRETPVVTNPSAVLLEITNIDANIELGATKSIT